MKTLFSKVKYDELELRNYPVKDIEVEYYKLLKESENIYGIEISKSENSKGKVNKEYMTIENITRNECVLNRILETFTEGKVTPVIAQDVIEDILYEEKARKI